MNIANRLAPDGFRRTSQAVILPDEKRVGSFRDFNIRPISREWKTCNGEIRRPAYRTAVANVGYIWRDSSPVDEYGRMPLAFAKRRFELLASGLMLPANAPDWACEEYTVWEEADRAAAVTGDLTAASSSHVMMTLPLSNRNQWISLVRDFVEAHLVDRGAVVAWAIHSLEADDGTWIVHPHVHLVVSSRHWRRDARHGQIHPGWLTSKARCRLLKQEWQTHLLKHTVWRLPGE